MKRTLILLFALLLSLAFLSACGKNTSDDASAANEQTAAAPASFELAEGITVIYDPAIAEVQSTVVTHQPESTETLESILCDRDGNWRLFPAESFQSEEAYTERLRSWSFGTTFREKTIGEFTVQTITNETDGQYLTYYFIPLNTASPYGVMAVVSSSDNHFESVETILATMKVQQQ